MLVLAQDIKKIKRKNIIKKRWAVFLLQSSGLCFKHLNIPITSRNWLVCVSVKWPRHL